MTQPKNLPLKSVGRPRSLSGRTQFQVTLEPEQFERLQDYCARFGMSQSAAVRQAVDLLCGEGIDRV